MDGRRRSHVRTRARPDATGTLITLTEEWIRSDVERRFGVGASPVERASFAIGAEIELLPQFRDSHRPVPAIAPDGISSVGVIRRIGSAESWRESVEGSDPPSWILASGARISFEPGGQIEISSARHATASALIAELHSITGTLSEVFASAEIELESRGVDPWNDVGNVPLQLHRARYTSMTRYFGSLDPAGVRMMRQTASVQVSVQPGDNPVARWKLLNAVAPYLVAIFSNSSRYADSATGHLSYRAHLWRTLDKSRTGVALPGNRAIGDYALFALNAGAIFASPCDGRYPSFLEWMNDGERTRADWELHLSTLFPEVRPKGFFEIRSPDMVDPRMIAVPIAFITGLVYDEAAAASAAGLLSGTDGSQLVIAGREGLRDGDIGAASIELANLAIAGCNALGEGYISSEDVRALTAFVDRYTRNGRCPADDQ